MSLTYHFLFGTGSEALCLQGSWQLHETFQLTVAGKVFQSLSEIYCLYYNKESVQHSQDTSNLLDQLEMFASNAQFDNKL